jgi:hypothetical protein
MMNSGSLNRHQKFLEISHRQGDLLRDIPTESFRRTSFDHVSTRASPGDIIQPALPLAGTATPLQAPPQLKPDSQIFDKPQSIMPIGVISDEDDDEDEPPTIAELIKDRLLCEALLDSLRQQKLDDYLQKGEDNSGDQASTPMLESIRSVETMMSTFSQQPTDSVRSVDTIMSFVSKFSSSRKLDTEPLHLGTNGDSALDDGVSQQPMDSVRSVDMIMSLLSKPSPRPCDTEPLPFRANENSAYDDEHSPQQRMNSIRFADTIMPLAAKKSPRPSDTEPLPFRFHGDTSFDDEDVCERPMHSGRSVDTIMSLVEKQSSRPSDTEPLPFRGTGDDAFGDEDIFEQPMDSIRSVNTIMQSSTEPLLIGRDHGGSETLGDDDDEDEPPTIADLMSDNMLCEALLGSLRLEPYKSQEDVMSSVEKSPN